jgi:hypothetical protein
MEEPRKWKWRTQEVVASSVTVSIEVVDNSDGLFEKLEAQNITLPYWADIWPPAIGLTAVLSKIKLNGKRVIDIGSGTG